MLRPSSEVPGKAGAEAKETGEAVTWMAVGIGGALGSLGRHAMGIITARVIGRSAPYATAIVNVSGCALIGWLAGMVAAGRWPMTPTMRTFLFVGVLGGFTTFSSFGLDTFT